MIFTKTKKSNSSNFLLDKNQLVSTKISNFGSGLVKTLLITTVIFGFGLTNLSINIASQENISNKSLSEFASFNSAQSQINLSNLENKLDYQLNQSSQNNTPTFDFLTVNSTTAPSTIRVAMLDKKYQTGYFNADCKQWATDKYPVSKIVEVNFKDYVKNVLPGEWIPSWNQESLRAGAVAIKTFAMYNIQNPKWKFLGNTFDVTDNVCDQKYIPNNSFDSTNKAVDETWNFYITENNKTPDIHYLDSKKNCSSSWINCMGKTDGEELAKKGKNWQEILKSFYKNIQVQNPLNIQTLANETVSIVLKEGSYVIISNPVSGFSGPAIRPTSCNNSTNPNRIPWNSKGKILKDPETCNNKTFYQISFENGQSGWVSEEFLKITDNPNSNPDQTFQIGDIVNPKIETFARIRKEGTNTILSGGAVKRTKASGIKGTILEKPIKATYENKEYTWYRITWSDSITGWTSQDLIELNSSNNCNFKDVGNSQTFYQNICNLKSQNIINGYSDNTFRPNSGVSRGEMAKFVKNGIFGNNYINTSCDDKFSDVSADQTFYKEITTLKCENIINGYSDKTFKPNNSVSRGEAMKFIITSAKNKNAKLSNSCEKTFTDVLKSHPFYEVITSSVCSGIINGFEDDSFRPQNTLSRGEMAKLVDKTRKIVSAN